MKKRKIGKLALNKETLKILNGRDEALLKGVRGGATELCNPTSPGNCTQGGFCGSSLCASIVTSPCQETTIWDTCECNHC